MATTDTLSLRLCSQCHGENPLRADCNLCDGTGLLDDNSEPVSVGPPFNQMTPASLVKLAEWTRRRGDGDAEQTRPARRTLSEINDRLLAALAKTHGEHSSVELTRNAKGDTQIKVNVRTGEQGIESIEEARMKAAEQYDHLCELYPMLPAAPGDSAKKTVILRERKAKGDN